MEILFGEKTKNFKRKKLSKSTLELECKKIIEAYKRGKTKRELYSMFSSYLVNKCLDTEMVIIDMMSKLKKEQLSEEEINELLNLLKRSRKISLNSKLMIKSIKWLNRLGIQRTANIIGYLIASKEISRNIKNSDNYEPISYVIEKVYKNNLYRVALTKPIIKLLLKLLLWYTEESKDESIYQYITDGIKARKRFKEYRLIYNRISKVAHEKQAMKIYRLLHS